jgi:hypothetical protein
MLQAGHLSPHEASNFELRGTFLVPENHMTIRNYRFAFVDLQV